MALEGEKEPSSPGDEAGDDDERVSETEIREPSRDSLYREWLPPPVKEKLVEEKERFHLVVLELLRVWRSGSPSSASETVHFVDTLQPYLIVKSEVAVEDVQLVAEVGIEVILRDRVNFDAQAHWVPLLRRIARKYRDHLNLTLDWRLLYDILRETHFQRHQFYEGLGSRSKHKSALVLFVRSFRYFFSPTSATEIWNELRPCFDDSYRESSLEAAGLLSLFLPMNVQQGLSRSYVFSSEWIVEVLQLWQSIPSCSFWSSHWLLLVSRCLRHHAMDWIPHLPTLFTHFLNLFHVPVGGTSKSPPANWIIYRVPSEFHFHTSTTIAQAIVNLLSASGDSQACFEKLVDYLEPYYHPSNGGSWTNDLELFLSSLVRQFLSRLEDAQETKNNWGAVERAAFVKQVIRLAEMGKFSKRRSLAQKCSDAFFKLSYVEPSLVLPAVIFSFETAMDSVTATHQLSLSLRTLALCVRPVLLWFQSEGSEPAAVHCRSALLKAMFSTLAGLDPNDGTKTLATIELYTSVLSSLSVSEISAGVSSSIFPLDWEIWSSEFLDRLFHLLQSLEPGIELPSAARTTTFLLSRGSSYDSLLKLLFGKLPWKHFTLLLERVARFVSGSVLFRVVPEVSRICSEATARETSTTSTASLLELVMNAFISTMSDAPCTGFCSDQLSNSKETMSPVLELTASYHLRILVWLVFRKGATLVQYKEWIKNVLLLAFNAPSQKVNNEGSVLLHTLISGLASYWIITSFQSCPGKGVEPWISSKESNTEFPPEWHLPTSEELEFQEELIHLHLRSPLSMLQRVAAKDIPFNSPDQEKDFICVLFLRLGAVLSGLETRLPDFHIHEKSHTVVGSPGVSLRHLTLRDQVAKILHESCSYLLKNKGDQSSILKLFISKTYVVVNFASTVHDASNLITLWKARKHRLTEPAANFITGPSSGPRRPFWMIHERVHLQNLRRLGHHVKFFDCHVSNCALPPGVELLSEDLLNLSLHQYTQIRSSARGVLYSLLDAYPALLPKCFSVLSGVLTNPKATEHSVRGACALLQTKEFVRYTHQDSSCLSSFVASILSSSHHDSIKGRTAINQVFTSFNWFYGGVFMDFDPESSVSHLTSSSLEGASVHWRYNLIAQGLLLFLALSPFSQSPDRRLSLISTASDRFLMSLTSEQPALRVVSVVALLLLLGAEADIRSDHTSLGETPIGGAFLSESSLEKLLEALCLDRHYAEGEGASLHDLGLVSWLPVHMEDWPRTRNWYLKSRGEEFERTSAKLFEQLTLRFGDTFLKFLRKPLENAVLTLQERAKQCVCAEMIAGVLRSGAGCAAAAWDEWLRSLLSEVLKCCRLESASEWAACIRFAMGASPVRQQLLECISELPSDSPSSLLVAKRLDFLNAAILELDPKRASEVEEALLLKLLQEGVDHLAHASSEVRTSSANLLCLLIAHLRVCGEKNIGDVAKEIEGVISSIIQRASAEAHKARAINHESSAENWDSESFRVLKTISRFTNACVRSGRFIVLADMLAELIHPLLLVQDTSEKELRGASRYALSCLKWQVFPASVLSKAVAGILRAASDEHWRARVAALSFLQAFVYRHSFILEPDAWRSVWDVVVQSLSDAQLEVREAASLTAAGMMRGAEGSSAVEEFRKASLSRALAVHKASKQPAAAANGVSTGVVDAHAAVLALAACLRSVPYEIPSWLPETITAVACLRDWPWPIRATVAKTVREFRRTHLDAWDVHKLHFSELQLELLFNSGAASYFA